MSQHVVVIGAGLMGATTALACLERGHRVTILDPGEPGGAQAASYGNGCWINNGALMPVSVPGLWRQVPGYLMDPLGPFAIRWRYLPRLLPWLARFVRAGATLAQVEATVRARRPLLDGTVASHTALAEAAGVSDLIVKRGLLYLYPDRAHFLAEALDWRMRRENGIVCRELDEQALRALEPGIGPAYRFGVHVPEAGCNLTDPGAYVAALVAHARSLGARVERSRATGFALSGTRLAAVITETGEIACDKAVIAAGAWSGALARQAGDAVSLETERGYHVVVRDPEYVPRHPIMTSDGKMAVTMTRAGLRAAGQVELGGLAAPPDWRRADIQLAYLNRVFPALSARPDEARLSRWMGHRPSTPDGLPSLGRASASPDIVHNFGHGHTGVSMAPASARLVADLVAGRPPAIDPTPYAPQRFSRRRGA